MTPDQYRKLSQSAPFLIAMSLKDASQLTLESDSPTDEHTPTIPTPGSEPIIGVIDTRFDKRNAYFTDWVDYHDEINQSWAMSLKIMCTVRRSRRLSSMAPH